MQYDPTLKKSVCVRVHALRGQSKTRTKKKEAVLHTSTPLAPICTKSMHPSTPRPSALAIGTGGGDGWAQISLHLSQPFFSHTDTHTTYT
jgi:hypothetical protein